VARECESGRPRTDMQSDKACQVWREKGKLVIGDVHVEWGNPEPGSARKVDGDIMMKSQKQLRIVVTGGADAPQAALELASAVGYEVLRRGHILVNGGAKGIDRSAAHGADRYCREAGPGFQGQIIAYRPSHSPEAASSRYTSVHVVESTHADRRDDVVRQGDILILLSGSKGTLDIARRARDYGKPVIPVGCSKGASLELWHQLLADDGKVYPYRRTISTERLEALNPLAYKVEEVARQTIELAEQVAGINAMAIPASQQLLQVFLCHSSGDKQAVREIYQRLSAEQGIVPWLDQEMLLPGQDWNLEITKAVRESHVVLVCLSKSSINKEGYVNKEIKMALDIADEKPEGAIFLIPLRLEECELPRRLSQWQALNYFESGAFDRLLRSLRLRAQSLGKICISGHDRKNFLKEVCEPDRM
jgi:uncharacterized protein (TIGR00725 family)